MSHDLPTTTHAADLPAESFDFESSRRNLLASAAIIGVAAASGFASRAGAQATPGVEASPVADPGATPAAVASAIPAEGTENQTRGAGGELRLLQWQSVTTLLTYHSTGIKDILGAQLVIEPLFRVGADGGLLPILAEEVPSKEAGTLADDLTWVTVKLKPEVLWSDGEPLTADDLLFTWEWNVDPANSSFSFNTFDEIESVEIIDDLTATYHFRTTNPIWIENLTGSGSSFVLPRHVLGTGEDGVNEAFGLAPIGTGPYVVESFSPNDQVIYAINENYREPNKPYFSRVILKGGGDAASAARAVLQTGDYDFAWNLQVEPEVLLDLVSEDGPGVLEVTPVTTLEEIDVNHSDPRTEVDGEVSQKDTPHPIFSDVRVRQALTHAIDRQQIADAFYLPGNEATPNVLVGNELLRSPNTALDYDPDKAAALLDETGWVLEGDVRVKDGQEFSITFSSSVNQVRQKTQALIKSQLEKVGIKVELVQVDAGQFFDGTPGNDQNINHFPWDLQEYGRGVLSALPVRFLNAWYAGPDGGNIAQKSNNWSGNNYTRWANDDFDALLEAARREPDGETLIQQLIDLNDLIVNDVAIIPLVQIGQNVGYSKRLNPANFGWTPFEYQYWNIANWNEVQE